MSLRTSVVCGTITFLAVAVLSLASLDMAGGEGFFMQGTIPLEASTPNADADPVAVEGDSAESPSTEHLIG